MSLPAIIYGWAQRRLISKNVPFHLINLAVFPPPVLTYCLSLGPFPMNVQIWSASFVMLCAFRASTCPPRPFSRGCWRWLVGSILCALPGMNLSEHARGTAFCTMRLPFLSRLDSAFPVTAGRMPWAAGQAVHAICLRDGNGGGTQRHTLSF